ncbi:hypothetical protein ABT063_45870 [Streptomyces sp. NPDC002838]|uniref:hypothetical protein n=1 Tax=Streptomyces sp. NPDC002838 TaxID=3154436 RepID=UPI00331DDC8E
MRRTRLLRLRHLDWGASWTLAAFDRVELRPGELCRITLHVDERRLWSRTASSAVAGWYSCATTRPVATRPIARDH